MKTLEITTGSTVFLALENSFNNAKVNEHMVELRNAKEIPGHDDTLPYVADLYIDNVKIGRCMNDGWGGDTDIRLNTADDKAVKLYNDVCDILKTCNWAVREYAGMKVPFSLDFLADILAEANI